jgi:hypothetical protein
MDAGMIRRVLVDQKEEMENVLRDGEMVERGHPSVWSD